ncbi:otoraplin-like isoform X2 [Syngnathoides biaculeatus]|uniref:otoraplin-like isoform X2 n=1 Tax=Syngnathoides biaculeatus TaxID=300417 RepID=UPI002ADD66CD|nr:otoraplin-like isoform X2 [Syngnathoides biaculeatus]
MSGHGPFLPPLCFEITFKHLQIPAHVRQFFKMRYPLVLVFCAGMLRRTSDAVLMEKLADEKICGDAECSYVLSMATALDDFIAPDCRFINIKKGQKVYVYSKLVPEEGGGVFWSGSVYSDRYVDQMGIIGYFPAPVVKEIHTFREETVQIATTV